MVRAHHGDGGQDRARAGNEQRAQSQAEHEPSRVPFGLALGDAGEGPLEEVSEGRGDEPRGHDAEDDEPGVGEEVLGQPDGAQQRGPHQGDDAEADDEAAHHRVGAVTAGAARSGRVGRCRTRAADGHAQAVARPSCPGRLPASGAVRRARRVLDPVVGCVVGGGHGGAGHEDDGEDGEDAGRDSADHPGHEPDDIQQEHYPANLPPGPPRRPGEAIVRRHALKMTSPRLCSRIFGAGKRSKSKTVQLPGTAHPSERSTA